MSDPTYGVQNYKPARTKDSILASLREQEDVLTSNLGPSHLYPATTILFQQGSAPKEAYLLEGGLVKLVRIGMNGQEVIIGLRAQGAILGAASIIVSKPHPVTAVTLTQCVMRPAPLKDFLNLAQTNLELSWSLHQAQSQEVYYQAEQLAEMRYLSARQRLENLLLGLITSLGLNKESEMIRLTLPLKHWEIAQLIGVTPEHLSRILRQAENEGVIIRDNGGLIICDCQTLFNG